MATYYIGADVHSSNTELAVEQRGKIVARYSVPTTITAISTVFDSRQGRKTLAMEEGKDSQGQTPLQLAENWKYTEIAELLHKFGAKEWQALNMAPFLLAAHYNRYTTRKPIISQFS